MKKEWIYEKKRYTILKNKRKYYLNGYSCNCSDIFEKVDDENEELAEWAKLRAKELFEKICRKRVEKQLGHKSILKVVKFSKVDFINNSEIKRLERCFSGFECKKWKFRGKQYIMHYDDKSKRVYLNGYQTRNCFDVWRNVDNPADSNMLKFKAEKNEIERLKDDGIYVYDYGSTSAYQLLSECLGNCIVFIVGIAFVLGIIYFIYWIWWGMIGEWAFEGPFADDTSAGEVTFKTIIFFIAFIVIIEEAIRRIINGHF